jgi:predicted acyl esterase
VRGRFADVLVPVFVMSGWQDGYKNPVERTVSGLSALGKPVQGLLGPWGHKYPFGGYPGPRIAWLQYTVTHWWDKWLKGKTPPPETDWPMLPVWLSASQAPTKSLCADEKGKWVAEDGEWASRVKERVLYLGAANRLGETPAKSNYASAKPLVLDTRCWRQAPGANAAMTISPAIRRASTRHPCISTANRCPPISIFSATRPWR